MSSNASNASFTHEVSGSETSKRASTEPQFKPRGVVDEDMIEHK